MQAFFNVMLREFGVNGIKVQEVVGLDEELLAFLPYVSNTTDGLLPRLTTPQQACLWTNLPFPVPG